MILGIGTDLVSIDRMRSALQRRPALAKRILSPEELALFSRHADPAAYLAKRFAAKEAIAKALGCGIGARMSWQDVTTRADASGCPRVELRGNAEQRMLSLGGKRCLLSLSDDAGLALAFALIES